MEKITRVIEFDRECAACNGTGLCIGMGERDGAAIECFKCGGAGCVHERITYIPFTVRKSINQEVKRVYKTNVGYVIGEDKDRNISLESFGGLTYGDWLARVPFSLGTEDRLHSCPAQFYQMTGGVRPNWEQCAIGITFKKCSRFDDKHNCWKKYDKEQLRLTNNLL